MKYKSFIFLFPVFLISFVSAHCPLCTIGAGAAAAGAVWLGVSKVVVALFIGAFAMSMGLWFSRIIKKQYIPFQRQLIIFGIFLATFLPLLPIISHTNPFYLSLFGDYGSLFNRTYIFNSSLLIGPLGGLLVFISPSLSKKITRLRGKTIPYQGIALTFSMLILMGVILQFLL